MLIISASADGSSSGLGRVTRMLYGMPATDMEGLWLFQDGDIGDEITTVTDRSGNGRHAALKSGWSAPKQRSYGAEIDNHDGAKFETGLRLNPAGQQQTVFIAGANILPGSEAGVYNVWYGSSINDISVPPTGTMTNAPALSITSNGTSPGPAITAFNADTSILGVNVLHLSGYPGFGQPGIWAIDIDASTDTVRVHGLGRTTSSRTNVGVSTYYDGTTDRGALTIGTWAHGAARSANDTISDLYAVAAYNRTFSEQTAQRYMQYMASMLADRGLTFA